MPILLVESGPDRGKSIHVSEGELFVVGRADESNLTLTDALTAPAHFKLKGVQGSFYLRDCRSGKGTFVNDNVVEQVRLEVGDKIQIGETILSFLDDPAAGRSQDPLVGKTIDRKYEITAHLGRGGMGTVYRATQLGLEREVALKVLSPQLAKDRSLVELFQREAQAAAALNHPNITQVYDVGQSDGLYYYSMEFFPGGSLEARLEREGRLPVDVAVGIVLDAARGLEYAERKELVHRDIKPDNLMVDADGKAKIADLGLATRGQRIQKGGRIFGTPHFISPEQALGKDVDHRSDIYSLGATFYRLLTGHTPFQGTDIKEILRKQVKEPCPSLREEHPEIPELIERIVHKMMQKDPADRYANASELIADLEAAATGSAASTGMKVAASLVALVLLGGGAFALFGPNGPEPVEEPPPVVVKDDEPKDTEPRRDPELERQLRETRAKAAYLELGETSEAAPFDAIAEQYPETEFGRLAAERADEIRAAEAAAAAAEAARRAHLRELMKTLEDDLAPLLEQHRYAGAHQTLESSVGIDELAASEAHGPRIEELRRKIRTDANLHFQDMQERARRLEVEHDYDGAREVMTDLVARYRPDEGKIDYLEDIVAEALEYEEQLTAREDAWLAALYEKDQKVFANIAGAPALLESLQRLQFDEAVQQIQGPLEKLHTKAYRGRLESFQTRWSRAPEVIESFKSAVRSGSLTRTDLDNDRIEGEIEAITGDTLVVRRRNRPEDVPLVELDTAARIADLLVDRWTIPAELRPAAASLFADLGLTHLALRGAEACRRLYAEAVELARESGEDQLLERLEREAAAADLYLRGAAAHEEGRHQLAIDLLTELKDEYRRSDVFAFLSDGSHPIYGAGSHPKKAKKPAKEEAGTTDENGGAGDSNGGSKEDREDGDEEGGAIPAAEALPADGPSGPQPKSKDDEGNDRRARGGDR